MGVGRVDSFFWFPCPPPLHIIPFPTLLANADPLLWLHLVEDLFSDTFATPHCHQSLQIASPFFAWRNLGSLKEPRMGWSYPLGGDDIAGNEAERNERGSCE